MGSIPITRSTPNPANQDDPHTQSIEVVGSVRSDPEGFRQFRKNSEGFRDVQQAAEASGRLPHTSERNESHTLTVREVARMFEAAGVAQTERRIVNW